MVEMIKYNKDYWDDIEVILPCIPNIKKLYNTSILITGGTGMICSSVADILFFLNKEYNANIEIILASRNKERITNRFSKFTLGKDYSFLLYDAAIHSEINQKADFLIHGASNANPASYTKYPVETILSNIIGLNSLLENAVKMNSQRLLYISSSEIYGKKDKNEPYFEDDYGYVDVLNLRACYPNAKRAAESLCIAYGQEHNLDTVIVRPGHIYGPTIIDSDNRASAQFTHNASRNENIVMKSPGMQLRSYCYTLDCASAILTVLINGERGNAYNISNSSSIATISDIASAFAKTVGRKVVYENPSDAEKQGYNLMSNSSLNSQKIESLGWSAKFSLDQGVQKTVNLYQNGGLA